MWFEKLVGFREENPEQVRNNLTVENGSLISKVNGKSFRCGTLEIPTLKELRLSAPSIGTFSDKILVSEIIDDIQNLHKDPENEGALFQVASQFNLLEMVSPYVIPERGVGIYENDFTQGPACAIACGAGTIYRNYFVRLRDQIGQTSNLQIDCLEEIGNMLRNKDLLLWKMQNGYALPNNDGLERINDQIRRLDKNEYEELKDKLKIGLQLNTEVTISERKSLVSQAYCSALPVAYSHIDTDNWEKFASLILNATYEATFYAALRNYKNTGSRKLFLTLVGGGAFGNDLRWIINAIEYSINKFRNTPIDVKIVSYGRSNPIIRELIEKVNKNK
jgi:hypothetical protein